VNAFPFDAETLLAARPKAAATQPPVATGRKISSLIAALVMRSP
jgi:hypothetical protein